MEAKVGTTTKRRSGWAKWGGRIGTFLAMGGWILVVVLGLGIAIGISVLTSGG